MSVPLPSAPSVQLVNSSGNRPGLEWLGKEGQQGGSLSRLCYHNPRGKETITVEHPEWEGTHIGHPVQLLIIMVTLYRHP